jgi:hypothetical protein
MRCRGCFSWSDVLSHQRSMNQNFMRCYSGRTLIVGLLPPPNVPRLKGELLTSRTGGELLVSGFSCPSAPPYSQFGSALAPYVMDQITHPNAHITIDSSTADSIAQAASVETSGEVQIQYCSRRLALKICSRSLEGACLLTFQLLGKLQ